MTTDRSPGATQPPLTERALQLASDLKQDLDVLVEHTVGSDARPASLARHLKLGQSLSARILRATRADDPVRVLDEVPAPHGLTMFLAAASDAGVDGALTGRAAATVMRFERLIAEFPTGRAGLNAAMAGWDPEAHARACNTAQQAIYRSMSTMLGFHAETMVHSYFVFPSQVDPAYADLGILMFKLGLQRLRPSSRITLFGHRVSGPASDVGWVETLDGDYAQDNLPGCFLPEFSSPDGIDRIELFRRPDLHLFTLPTDEPPLGVSLDVCGATVLRKSSPRVAQGDQRWLWETVVPRLPAKSMLVDVFVHRDLLPARGEPRLTHSLHGLNHASERPDDPELDLDQMQLPLSLEAFEPSDRRLKFTGVRQYVPAVHRMCEAIGASVGAFAGYRLSVRYPAPLISHTVWIPLDDGASSTTKWGGP
ncbi:MAG: hypothetical protein AAGI30_01685 [Planctomycetota bacterium]